MVIRRGIARVAGALATVGLLTACFFWSAGRATLSAAQDAYLVGQYDVVGDILSSRELPYEPAGEELQRSWSVAQACTTGCRLVLTRDLAAESEVPPMSAVLHPTSGGWTAHFVETEGCPGPGSSFVSTEYSSWKLWMTSAGIQATETGISPPSTGCDPSSITIHWYATKVSAGQTPT